MILMRREQLVETKNTIFKTIKVDSTKMQRFPSV